MKFTTFLLGLMTFAGLGCIPSDTLAACSDKPIKYKWAIQSGDQRVSGEYVQKTVLGKKVRFNKAYENYKKDGSYFFFDGSNRHVPDGYRFYSDGSRCLNYQNPRYDLYVVRDNKLLLINQHGGRFVAKLTR